MNSPGVDPSRAGRASGPGAAAPAGRVVLAGIGNEMRHDDGIGPVIARRAARMSSVRPGAFVTALASPLNEPLDLLDDWDRDDLAIVVDAVRSGAPPGTVTLTWLEPAGRRCPAGPLRPGQHPRPGCGGCLPPRLRDRSGTAAGRPGWRRGPGLFPWRGPEPSG